MEITLEMAERLKEKANVSYAQAKEALEYSGGNLLDALIYLEEKGILPRTEGAYFSTRSETPPPAPEPPSLETPIKLKSKDDRPPGAKPGGASSASFPPCAAGWWTTSWRSGGRASPLPPCRC